MKVKYTFLVLMTVLALMSSACGGGVAATDVPAAATDPTSSRLQV
jgi:hypothetical protein